MNELESSGNESSTSFDNETVFGVSEQRTKNLSDWKVNVVKV